ncbi:hypothetical protein ONE63_004170 [Megalurothrips usitatus]|uniref:Mitochondrial ribosome-associated GTPase 2 n=1 Tax=Megalurothrips usitatus TaxID=439358 RepID=A0AAV7X4J0_9NEOP|nr:hypothetical protein ONE63_004170 [Megalurothrips usitatus]
MNLKLNCSHLIDKTVLPRDGGIASALQSWADCDCDILFYSFYVLNHSVVDFQRAPVITQTLLIGKNEFSDLFVTAILELQSMFEMANYKIAVEDSVDEAPSNKRFILKNGSDEFLLAELYLRHSGGVTHPIILLHVDTLALAMFPLSSWRQLWAKNVYVTVQSGKPCVGGICPYPVSYTFDISYTVNESFTEDKFYTLLWDVAGEVLSDVVKVSEFYCISSSKRSLCFRLCYLSYEIPMCRKAVLEFHQNVLGSTLESILGVCIKFSIPRLIVQWSHCRGPWSIRLLSGDVAAVPLRPKKGKSFKNIAKSMVDYRKVMAVGGNGGDGCISLLRIFSNEFAGPDGGDGGSGGHIVFHATREVRDLAHIPPTIKAEHGEPGQNKNCFGKNAKHTVVKVPVGTVIKNDAGKVVGDLELENTLFVAARGGSGGRGNYYFRTDVNQTPQVAEYGGEGESMTYFLEMRSMADIGLIGFPNAGKSTLLQAISRAKPKVAPYPFTTLRPYIGIVQYSDHTQLAVADLPGLVVDSHKNKGLGVGFLRHAERCSALAMVLDLSEPEPWHQLDALRNELKHFSPELAERPQLIIANKIDLPDSQENYQHLLQRIGDEIIPVSGKTGENLTRLLQRFQAIHTEYIMTKESAIKEIDI